VTQDRVAIDDLVRLRRQNAALKVQLLHAARAAAGSEDASVLSPSASRSADSNTSFESSSEVASPLGRQNSALEEAGGREEEGRLALQGMHAVEEAVRNLEGQAAALAGAGLQEGLSALEVAIEEVEANALALAAAGEVSVSKMDDDGDRERGLEQELYIARDEVRALDVKLEASRRFSKALTVNRDKLVEERNLLRESLASNVQEKADALEEEKNNQVEKNAALAVSVESPASPSLRASPPPEEPSPRASPALAPQEPTSPGSDIKSSRASSRFSEEPSSLSPGTPGKEGKSKSMWKRVFSLSGKKKEKKDSPDKKESPQAP